DVLSVNIEESIPTWYSSLALFLAASLLGWIALIKLIHREPFRVYWLGLALIFVYLSADEGAALHETASAPLQSAFNTSGFVELSVSIEESIPTWYSSLALFLAASLLGWIALIKLIHREPFRVYWLGLALIFVYLSADEGAALHETASAPLQSAFNTSGFFE